MNEELEIIVRRIDDIASRLENAGDCEGASQFLAEIASQATHRKSVLDLWRSPESVSV